MDNYIPHSIKRAVDGYSNSSHYWEKMLDDYLVKTFEKSEEGITHVARGKYR
ncbi:MAG TPA: hypothetical protein VH481_10950 [Nitrososphaeraceae archaeon]|jgi:hypothetical protein